MRNKINILGAILLFLILANSCVDDTIQLLNVEKPASIEQLEYLNDYDELKTYIDRSAYPNFKLGAGVTVSDIFFPASEIPKAESFETKLQTSFVVDKFTHLVFITSY
jgi:hypothetical protein